MRLDVSEEETRLWQGLVQTMELGLDVESGLFEQFQGSSGLEEIDLGAYPEWCPWTCCRGGERIQHGRVLKQDDVVLLYLLWDRLRPRVREANFRYDESRTGHGSSLSPAIQALVARLGDLALAERSFRQAAEVDLGNTMDNAASGVHIATLGGFWQTTVCGFAGVYGARRAQPGSTPAAGLASPGRSAPRETRRPSPVRSVRPSTSINRGTSGRCEPASSWSGRGACARVRRRPWLGAACRVERRAPSTAIRAGARGRPDRPGLAWARGPGAGRHDAGSRQRHTSPGARVVGAGTRKR